MPTIQIKYCLTCGREVSISDLQAKTPFHVIEKVMMIDGPSEYGICEGPFAETKPPEQLEENWQDHLIEPSGGELCNISFQALELQSDFLETIYQTKRYPMN